MSESKDDMYRIKNRYSVVVHDVDRVEFRQGVWNPTSTTLSDDSRSGKLARTIELLDGSHSIADVAKKSEQSVQDVQAVVSHLEDQGIISLQADNYLDQYVDLVQGRRAPLQKWPSPVVLVGPPEISEPIHKGLLRTVPDLQITVADENHPISLLDHTDNKWLEDGLEFHRRVQQFDSLRDGFVVYTESIANPVKTRMVDRIMDHLGVPWLYGVVDGPFVLVGPTTVPERTPSWDAYETRMLMNLRESASYQAYKKALANGRANHNTDFEVHPILAQLLASLLLPEAVSWITTGTAGTLFHAYSFFTPTSEFSVHEILPLPNSTVGLPVAERDDFELYFGTRVLERIAE